MNRPYGGGNFQAPKETIYRDKIEEEKMEHIRVAVDKFRDQLNEYSPYDGVRIIENLVEKLVRERATAVVEARARLSRAEKELDRVIFIAPDPLRSLAEATMKEVEQEYAQNVSHD